MKKPAFTYDRISPTAKLVAYWRQFSDIPFSKDIASLFKVDEVYKEMFDGIGAGGLQTSALAPILEIRYKCIWHFIKQSRIRQVLEFASGISLRGLAMTADPEITYVETDLPDLTEEKVNLIETLIDRHQIKHRDNLYFHHTNILSFAEIEPALTHFSQNHPLVIVHEGLFQYLTKEEKATAAKNIHAILKKFGGVWITPDLDNKASLHKHTFDQKSYQGFIDNIEKTTGCNFEYNAFENDDEVFSFFRELGFDVNWQPQMSPDIRLSSLANKEVPSALMDVLRDLRLWVLTVEV